MSKLSATSFLASFWKLGSWFVPTAADFLALSLNFASVNNTWELDATSFWFNFPPAAVFSAHCVMRFDSRWLGALSIPGRLDALQLSAVGELVTERGMRFNDDFDFVTFLSSPVPRCILFDVTSGQLAELKMLLLNKSRRFVHSSRVKLSFVCLSASWLLVSTHLICGFWGPEWFCQIINQE